MERESGKIEKLYYTIGEVADMFNVNTSLIRYWEKENKADTVNNFEVIKILKDLKSQLNNIKDSL